MSCRNVTHRTRVPWKMRKQKCEIKTLIHNQKWHLKERPSVARSHAVVASVVGYVVAAAGGKN
jgi:hypothetical protein